MLDAAAGADEYQTISPQWFAQLPGVSTSSGQWIVRLTPAATQEAGSVAGVAELLNRELCRFVVVRGLGLPGQVLVQADTLTEEARAALAANLNVATFESNSYFYAQAEPDDDDFPLQAGLSNINAPAAWEDNSSGTTRLRTGSTSVVVGVIDSGIDYTHPDLYLNVWLNQGEIPAALKPLLVDTDNDKRITFYDLNAEANASLVSRINANSYIDAGDLLADVRWADGKDTDRNGFTDDFIGWNFRSAADEPFAPNDPRDGLGHGTHVAGTIGAVGNNAQGVTGINWRSSLMALRYLDNEKKGSPEEAIAAVNYATMMRERFGEPVRVLNASWGQSGSENAGLRAAIEAAGRADMLFVAAAGNGNLFGQGIDLDRSPFFPASSDLPNVISVAASGPADELARFSNFGRTSVDLSAPGVSVLSTLPGNRYGATNGTSMAAPHVAGVAALILADLPFATAAEVRQAILSTVDPRPDADRPTSTGGRLNAQRAINSTVFAPRASLDDADDIDAAGGTENLITVRYHDRQGINDATIGDGDLIATRQWGPRDTIAATLVADSIVITNGGTDVTAIYRIAAPGGTWDPLDFGGYVLSVVAGQVKNASGLSVPTDPFGEFSVRVVDPTVYYVNSFLDAVDANVGDGSCAADNGDCTLRSAIQESNAAAPDQRTIILDEGTFQLSLAPVMESLGQFPDPESLSGCYYGEAPVTFSDTHSGDLNIWGQVRIIGSQASSTTINGHGVDRLFTVHPGSQLTLSRVTLTEGSALHGGGILAAGDLDVDLVTLTSNIATASGGGIAIWGGHLRIERSTISDNVAQRGGGLFICNLATAELNSTTLSTNSATVSGGAMMSSLSGPVEITNSTLSHNDTTLGATIAGSQPRSGGGDNSISDGGRFVVYISTDEDVVVYDSLNRGTEIVSVDLNGTPVKGFHNSPSISRDGRFVAFTSDAQDLVVDPTHNFQDVFVYDRFNHQMERISFGLDGNDPSQSHSSQISADGRFVVFVSSASDLVADDTNDRDDIYVYDRLLRRHERVNVASDGTQADNFGSSPTISEDGRFVSFISSASNLVSNDTNGREDVFVVDRNTPSIQRVSIATDGTQGDADSFASAISANGRFVTFSSLATNLVSGDTNNWPDVFVYDIQLQQLERTSIAANGDQGNEFSGASTISKDGRIVVFSSDASNLVPEDTNGQSDVFIVDRTTREVWRVTATDNSEADQASFSPLVSSDGRFVALFSHASNFGSGDDGFHGQVYLYSRQSQESQAVSFSAPDPISLESATVAGNRGNGTLAGRTTAHNSLFLANSSLAKLTSDFGKDTHSLGHNLTDKSSNKLLASDLVAPQASLSLGPLQSNGGPTWAHALLPGSPAIDAADSSAFPIVDQFGITRPQNGDGVLGSQPDIGALEAYDATISGVVFRDSNKNGRRDQDEAGFPGQEVYLDLNQNGQHDPTEMSTTTRIDDPITTTITEAGTYNFGELQPGNYRIGIDTPPSWTPITSTAIERISSASNGAEGNQGSVDTAVSGDGRYVVFSSSASNLVPGDTNGDSPSAVKPSDIFVYDRQSQQMERINVADDGTQAEAGSFSSRPGISDDGRFVVFESNAANLVVNDTNNATDIFVYDRQFRRIERISVGNLSSAFASISADGRFVTFSSYASNLVFGDTNNKADIFLYDRQLQHINRISIANDGTQGTEDSREPSISADGRSVVFVTASALVEDDANDTSDVYCFDSVGGRVERVSIADDGADGNSFSSAASISASGRFVTFSSLATNLFSGDANGESDVFVYDRMDRRSELISLSLEGGPGNGISNVSTISADGRFVTFLSFASNLVIGDTNGFADVFVADRANRQIVQLSVAANGLGGNADSFVFGFRPPPMPFVFASTPPGGWPVVSQDGRVVTFASAASNFVSGDSGQFADVFLAPNPLATNANTRGVGLYAGQVVSNVDFGLVSGPGEIRGVCFDDVIANGLRDEGEPGRAECVVYLDLNANGRFDPVDRSTTSGADGTYVLANLDSEMEYRIGLVVPSGQSLVFPSAEDEGFWQVFLRAGGTLEDRDFGLQPANTEGQFENGVIQGRVLAEQAGSGGQGLGGVLVFVDLDNDGILDFDEPRTVSKATDDPGTPNIDERGTYVFTDLGGRAYTVRAVDGPKLKQTAPIGNKLVNRAQPLADQGSLLGTPWDVVVGDFNDDGWPDLATANYEDNSVSILLNDQNGGFASLPPIKLAPAGNQPIALVAGNFDGQGGDDLAVANTFSSNVAILLNFQQGAFGSVNFVNVGKRNLNPLTFVKNIASGDLDQDDDLDLFVLNALPNAPGSVSVLRNNGQGVFSEDSTLLPAGINPSAIVMGQFGGDERPDLAVASFGKGKNVGDFRLLTAQASGAFTSSMPCAVGFGPVAMAAAFLNDDAHLDLAVANFSTNNITICLGSGNGTFQAGPLLGGGGGPTDISAVDIDGDDDMDLLIADGNSQKISILRSRLSQGSFEFEPIEDTGVGTIKEPETLVLLATGNFDGDPNQPGSLDVVSVNNKKPGAIVQFNSLVGGAHRRAVNGVETVAGLDFAFLPLNLPPTLSAILSPAAVNEDSGVLAVAIAGISAGSGETQPLRVSVSTDNPTLFASATVMHDGADAAGGIVLTLAADQSGQALVTVTVTDGGLDDDLDTIGDNATIQQSFTVTVNPLDDPPTVTADDFDVLLNSGPNVLDVLASDSIAPDLDETLTLIFVVPPAAAVGTLVIENNRLKYTPAAGFVGEFTTQYFVSDGGIPVSVDVSIAVNDPVGNPWFNKLNRFDVTGDKFVVADDALAVINFLNAFGSLPVPPDASPSGLFYDVNGDRTVASGDALDVINFLNAFGADGEGEAARSSNRGLSNSLPSAVASNGPYLPDDLISLLAIDIASKPKRRR